MQRVNLEINKNDKSYEVKGHIELHEGFNCIRFGAEIDRKCIFYGNPITKGHKIPKLKTFKEAKEIVLKEVYED